MSAWMSALWLQKTQEVRREIDCKTAALADGMESMRRMITAQELRMGVKPDSPVRYLRL